MKSFISIIFIIVIVSTTAYPQQLSAVEYFLNNDPGVSNAIQIPVQGIDTNQLGFSVNTMNLEDGIHTLIARAIDDSSQSSLTSTIEFIKVNNITKDIVAVEYFFDLDPGVGNGITIPTAPTADTSLAFSVNTSDLLAGLHALYVRTIDDQQVASISDVFYFIKYVSANKQLIKGEYFFDLDPGIGMAHAFAASGSAAINQIVPISIPQLLQGFHYLFVRVKDSSGWSMTLSVPFVKIPTKSMAFNRGEYFIDNDPGIGQALTFGSGTQNPSGIALAVNISNLSIGAHTLFIRTQDSCTQWSITSSIDFFKIQVLNEFDRLEYFIDADPGFGNGILVPIAGLDTTGLIIQPDIAALADGVHTLSVRSSTQVGSWSQTETIYFFKYADKNSQLTGGEYFFNSNLSHGTGMQFEFINTTDTAHLMSLDLSSLQNGINYLFYRTKDLLGNWSHTAVHPFIKSSENDVRVVSFEYFIDIDPGYGQANQMALPPIYDTAGLSLTFNTNHLTSGYYKLYVRAYDELGQWSMTNEIDFVKYCVDSIALIDIVIPDSFYEANASIRSNGTMNPELTTFKSMEVNLLPGFSVPLGVQFVAENGDCPTESGAAIGRLNSAENAESNSMQCICKKTICECKHKEKLFSKKPIK